MAYQRGTCVWPCGVSAELLTEHHHNARSGVGKAIANKRSTIPMPPNAGRANPSEEDGNGLVSWILSL
jgi:hypothetical protein